MMKKLYAALLSIVMIAAINIIMPATAKADCTDTNFSWHWGFFPAWQYTPDRYKDNTSYVYLNPNRVKSRMIGRVHVQALINGGWTDVSGGHEYQIVPGRVVKMVNFVVERGYHIASIAAYSGATHHDDGGLWSPDYCSF